MGFCPCQLLARQFALNFIAALKERAEVIPNAGKRVKSGNVLKLGSDCTGLGSDFVALKFALRESSVELKTAFISDTGLVSFNNINQLNRYYIS